MNELEIFSAALGFDAPQERARYLDQACGGDAELRGRIETLLRSAGKAAGFMESPPAGVVSTVDLAISERPGSQVGPYKLLQEIGEGGFGVVFMAEQTAPVQRKVALKVIKPGMDTRQVVARFEAERQALALMEHPNIAKVFDGGTTASGLPYFVMELVRGIPLTDYCDENKLPVKARLELFAAVCRAIQHAHHKGIIHRDIKPSNGMVTLHDGKPVPKVIDFGISKAISQRLTEKTMFTAYGDMIGTPAYMSPEQAEMSGLDTDMRSDIYSLGVLLYELLTGTTPLLAERLRSAGYAEIQRLIREEEPPRPSTRISTLGGQVSSQAAGRGTELKRLSQFVRGDLDWIVMKALEKDRNRRYDTPNAFADDVERFLRHEPVLARSPSTMYRLRKFVRRNKARLTLASAITVAALISIYAVTATIRGWQRQAELARKVQQTAGVVQLKASELQRKNAEAQRIKWAREIAIPQILQWKTSERVVSAFKLAREVQEVIPDDPVFLQLWSELTGTTSVTSNPPGVRVSIRDWNVVEGEWLVVGTTPIETIQLPAGPMRWRCEKAGFVPRESQLKSLPQKAETALADESKHPGMVGVAEREWEGEGEDSPRTLRGFLIDQHEVTNRDYQEFVDAGGYENHDYWQDEFINEHGESINRETALKEFVDVTGRPGPKLWREGRYLQGQDDYPVRGVSWYEAMAYARFAKKLLPTIHHWRWAAYGERKHIRPLSNLNSSGPDPVGRNQGIGIFGVYDMLGNVAEWCFNKYGDHRRCLLGADWKSPSYMAGAIDHAPPMSRDERYGFRCARYRYDAKEDGWAFLSHDPGEIRLSPPATAEEIEQYLRLVEYDKVAKLNEEFVTSDRDPGDPELRHEIVRIDAAYGEERFDIHLLIPRHGQPPFQAIVWFPGASALENQSQEERRRTAEFAYERALAKTGRIVCSPVYKGTYERFQKNREGAVRHREWRIQMTKDLFRAVDYLEKRQDVDSRSLVYCGLSMGAMFAPYHLVAEPRFKFAVLFAAGAKGAPKSPEVDPQRYAPHVKTPILVLNGEFDTIFRYDEHQLPFFERLGTSDKQLELYPAGHAPPIRESVRFADQWLRKHTEPRPQ